MLLSSYDNDIIKSLQDNNVGIEISTKGLRKVNDFYPCRQILQEIAKHNVKVVISDDAHLTSELGMDFEKAEKELGKYGISRRLKF